MTTVTPKTLNVLAPSELTAGDRVIGWLEDTGSTFTEIPWDDSHDREWTVESVAMGTKQVRIDYTDDTLMLFDPEALMVITRTRS